jgi:RNA-directed DNA polymerase
VRYIDDFVICFQYRSDAIRVQDALRLRLGKFGLTLAGCGKSPSIGSRFGV